MATTSRRGRSRGSRTPGPSLQNETAGWVKSIHATGGGGLLGLVMIGPHVTDMIEAGVVAIDSNAAVETVADGMAPHAVGGHQGRRSRRARPGDRRPEPESGPATRIHDEHNLSLQPT